MENVYEFAFAALPWVAMGIALVVIVTRMTIQVKNDPGSRDCGPLGMLFGIAIGSGMGSLLGEYTMGAMLGMLFGYAIGMTFKKPSGGGQE